MKYRCSLFLLTALMTPLGLIPSSATPLYRPDKPELILTPAATRIRVYDPLFMKAVLINHTESPIDFCERFHWLFRRQGDMEFEDLGITHCDCKIWRPERLSPKGRFADYGVFYDFTPVYYKDPVRKDRAGRSYRAGPDRAVFMTPGIYEIKAKAFLVDFYDPRSRLEGKWIESASVSIEVSSLEKSEQNVIETWPLVIQKALLMYDGFAVLEDPVLLEKIESKLADSLLKKNAALAHCFR